MTLPSGRRCPGSPPSVIWYHSSLFLSTPRMPMWPTWWWPQEFMQPEMLRSNVADVVQVVEVVEACLDGVGDRDRAALARRRNRRRGSRSCRSAGRCSVWRGRRPWLPATARTGRRCAHRPAPGSARAHDAQFAEAVAVGQVGDGPSASEVMSPGAVPVSSATGDRGVARHAVRCARCARPSGRRPESACCATKASSS
jgi:hypothetical protein